MCHFNDSLVSKIKLHHKGFKKIVELALESTPVNQVHQAPTLIKPLCDSRTWYDTTATTKQIKTRHSLKRNIHYLSQLELPAAMCSWMSSASSCQQHNNSEKGWKFLLFEFKLKHAANVGTKEWNSLFRWCSNRLPDKRACH